MNADFLAGLVIGIVAGCGLIISTIACIMWMSERMEK